MFNATLTITGQKSEIYRGLHFRIRHSFIFFIIIGRPLQLRGKQADPIEGEFCLVKSKNYQAFLAAIGKVDFLATLVALHFTPVSN